MPRWMSDDEERQHQRNAARQAEQGHRKRAWLIRAFYLTSIGDLAHRKVWPKQAGGN